MSADIRIAAYAALEAAQRRRRRSRRRPRAHAVAGVYYYVLRTSYDSWTSANSNQAQVVAA